MTGYGAGEMLVFFDEHQARDMTAFDLRFLLRAKAGQSLAISDESLDLRWFQPDELVAATDEESVLRMARKTVGLSFGG